MLGGRIVSGVDAVADEVELDDRIEEADLVVTGEGFLDAASFAGKVVGGIVERAEWAKKPVLVVVGDADDARHGRRASACAAPPHVVSLTALHGDDAARANTVALVRAEVSRYLRSLRSVASLPWQKTWLTGCASRLTSVGVARDHRRGRRRVVRRCGACAVIFPPLLDRGDDRLPAQPGGHPDRSARHATAPRPLP